MKLSERTREQIAIDYANKAAGVRDVALFSQDEESSLTPKILRLLELRIRRQLVEEPERRNATIAISHLLILIEAYKRLQ